MASFGAAKAGRQLASFGALGRPQQSDWLRSAHAADRNTAIGFVRRIRLPRSRQLAVIEKDAVVVECGTSVAIVIGDGPAAVLRFSFQRRVRTICYLLQIGYFEKEIA